MKLALITGTSKGLGEATAKLLMDLGYTVVGFARSDNKDLNKYHAKGSYHHISLDLSEVDKTEKTLKAFTSNLNYDLISECVIINNAALVQPIEQVGKQSTTSLKKHVHVNLLAPMLFTNHFLNVWGDNIDLKIANITSGAANRSVYGWSAYGSTKAALDRYSDTVAIEQEELENKHKIILFDPSIMDTGMQGEIRSADTSQFKEVENFKQLKIENRLRNTNIVAEVLVKILQNENELKNGEYYSIHDYVKE
ncbi:SDR family NAD(P)-dependent oxidoreductase [Saliterribacillus persicus]|uniref:Benzil reductase ((S)-benzoin forming) n=1 Tax=Saliterribacillus persicus TaxID=930114 RepID=A0A368XR57_9BACI|nr:SDR family NAD(P)-dependent oxidoreductase [Saliterribacillus persicus]RCW69636.1 benzil reductase ((S)-benzoin forming) [Saliterribacillus persicus]